jgi:hypothetical protein
MGRGVTVNMDDGETDDLPWEGFEEEGMEGDNSLGGLDGWRTSVH